MARINLYFTFEIYVYIEDYILMCKKRTFVWYCSLSIYGTVLKLLVKILTLRASHSKQILTLLEQDSLRKDSWEQSNFRYASNLPFKSNQSQLYGDRGER